MIIAHLQGLILHSLKIIQYKINLFLPSCSPHAPSDARHIPTVSLLHGLTETEPLPIIPMDTVIYMGTGAGQRAAAPGPLPSSRADTMDTPVGQVTSPKGCGVLIGWLHALGKRAWTISIYREASMVTLARSGKGLGGEKQERKRRKVWQDHCPLVGSGRVNAFLSYIPVLMSVSLINGKRDMEIPST